MEILRLENLSFTYGEENRKLALDHISLCVESGKYYSIIGHNGSGKSTLAKLIMGLLAPSGGKIFMFGEELTDENLPKMRQRIGIVFQNPDNQFIGSTVRDDIAFGLENRRVPHEDMDAIIEEFAHKVNMHEFLDKEPSNLSGGQKQRVAIAGVLAMKPDVIILDEATAMLDPKGRREISEVIAQLRKENKDLTILSITHDIDEASSSDEVIILNKGSLYKKGKPEEIFVDDTSLEDIRLDMPFVFRLHKALKDEGVDTEFGKTMEEMVNNICR